MCDGYVPHPMDSAHNSLSHKSSLSYPVNDIAPKMKLTSLPIVLTLLPSAAATDSSYMITKSFNFKDDYYLKICPLSNAIAPNNVDLLMAALEEYGASHFKAEWENQLKSDLHNGTCTIDVRMRVVLLNSLEHSLALSLTFSFAGHVYSRVLCL